MKKPFSTFLLADDEMTDQTMFQAVRLELLVVAVVVILTISHYNSATS